MKLDYDLIEKIGATHYAIGSNRPYKVNGVYLLAWSFDRDKWITDASGHGWVLTNVKPIPPRPEAEFEYNCVFRESLIMAIKIGCDLFVSPEASKFVLVDSNKDLFSYITQGVKLYTRREVKKELGAKGD